MPSPIPYKAPYSIQATPYGGRGAFASTSLEKDTLILACAGPYASVILRKFRKEACAWCFAYAFESGKNSWSVRVDGAGAWFCTEDCKEKWFADEQHSGIHVALNTALDKTLKRKKQKNDGSEVPSQLGFLNTLKSEDVNPELIQKAWTIAEQVYAKSGPSVIVEPNEFELDTSRFILEGLSRRALEESTLDHFTHLDDGASLLYASTGTWTDMLRLQVNEQTLVQKQPAMLLTHIRVYGFLRQVIANLRQVVPRKGDKNTRLNQLVDLLQRYTITSEATRALLGRDHGNVFGIWDNGIEENEMLGWGMYVFGSYFNHDCSPNVVKSRSGRAMHFTTTRAVSQGKELCISYVDIGQNTTASERCQELSKEWFFSCLCSRCKSEMETIADAGHPQK